MIPSESDPQFELLRSIATSLKGIQSSLDQLTAAVEGVSESIEQAHEPEGDLGHHLVGALKDISSALHKRAQQERAPQPQARQNPLFQQNQQNRRDDRPERLQRRPDHQQDRPVHESTPSLDREHYHQEDEEHHAPFEAETGSETFTDQSAPSVQSPQPPQSLQGAGPRKRPRRRRGGKEPAPQKADGFTEGANPSV